MASSTTTALAFRLPNADHELLRELALRGETPAACARRLLLEVLHGEPSSAVGVAPSRERFEEAKGALEEHAGTLRRLGEGPRRGWEAGHEARQAALDGGRVRHDESGDSLGVREVGK